MKEKGSITIYLALVMTVLLSVITTGIYSLQIATARLEMVSAVDLGLYSLFGQYDKEMMEQYQLLFVDGGVQTGTLQMGEIFSRLNAKIADNLRTTEIVGGSINGYAVATDGNGAVFKGQAVAYMEKTLGAYGVQQLIGKLSKENETVAAQEQLRTHPQSDDALLTYQQLKEENTVEMPPEEEPEVVDENFVNPIENINEMKKMGVLKWVVPSGQTVSNKQIDRSDLVSERTLQTGMGVVPAEDHSLQSKLLFQEYMVRTCTSYTATQKAGALDYQLEYILQGKDNDVENLKGVANQLLLIRETVNVLHLLNDPGKKAQLSTAALTIATAMLMPQLQPAIEGILLLCWAYGESVLDVRELLAGGKSALVKDNHSWQLSLENLAHLSQGLDGLRKSSDKGLDYPGYLKILLALKDGGTQVMRCMDVVELKVNQDGKCLRLDSCIASLDAEIEMKIAKKTFHVNRSYGYDM